MRTVLWKTFFAIITLSIAGGCGPSYPPEVEEALEAERLRNFEEAADILIKAEKENPDEAVYPHQLGMLYNRNLMDFFKGDLQTIPIEDPEYRPLREAVMMQDVDGTLIGYMIMDLSPVIEPFLRAIEKDPDLVEAYIEAASLYAEMNSMEEAFALLETARQRFPRNHKLPFMRGFYHLHLREYDDAIIYLEKAAELNSRFSGTFRYLGEAQLAAGNTLDAEDAFDQVLRLDQDADDVKTALSLMLNFYYSNRQYEEAARWAIRNENRLRRFPDLMLVAGKAAYLSDDQKAALRMLESAYNQDKKDAFSLALLGELSIDQEKYAMAEDYFLESLRLSPREHVFYQLGSLYLDKYESPGRAIPALEEAVSISPDYYPALYQLALAYTKAGKPAAVQQEAWENYIHAAEGQDNPAYIEHAKELIELIRRK